MAHQAQIKNIETYLLLDENQDDKGDGTKKLLKGKEDTIHLLKKKLNIPTTQLIQALEILELEKDKDSLNGKLTDCQAQLLKFVEKQKQWQKNMTLIVESEKALKNKADDLDKRLQEKEMELQEKEK